MEPKEILRTIESYLNLKPITLPEIKEDTKHYASGAVIICEEEITIIVRDKKDLEVLAEELTHIADYKSGKPVIKNYEDLFYHKVLREALGYCSSKLFTPGRKPLPIRKKLKKSIEEKNWKELGWAYNYDQSDEKIHHQIGYDLGEKIYGYTKKTGNKKPALSLVIKNRFRKKPFEVYKKILVEVTK